MNKGDQMKFKSGGMLVFLEPDVAKAFPNGRSVNAALRKVLRQKTGKKKSPARRRSRARV
jgi:hypothetical protein